MQFRKAFQERFVDRSDNAEFKAQFRRAGCFVCHEKGTDRKLRNAFGQELAKLIEGEAQQRLKEASKNGTREAEIEKLLAEFQAALDKVTKMDTGNGETYGERIARGQLPVPFSPAQ
jgi:cytochrome c553